MDLSLLDGQRRNLPHALRSWVEQTNKVGMYFSSSIKFSEITGEVRSNQLTGTAQSDLQDTLVKRSGHLIWPNVKPQSLKRDGKPEEHSGEMPLEKVLLQLKLVVALL